MPYFPLSFTLMNYHGIKSPTNSSMLNFFLVLLLDLLDHMHCTNPLPGYNG